MKITAKEIECIVRHETERLNKLAQQNGDPLEHLEIGGYITGVAQLSGNIIVLLNNREDAGPDARTCWKCCNLLETKDGKDYAGRAVQVCCECEATIRD